VVGAKRKDNYIMKSQKPPTPALLILIVAGTLAGTVLIATTPTRTATPDSIIESPAIIEFQGMTEGNGELTIPQSVSKSNSAPGRVQGVKIVVNN
jgi:hypothetical protein